MVEILLISAARTLALGLLVGLGLRFGVRAIPTLK